MEATTKVQKAAWIKKSVAAGGEFHAFKQSPWRHNLLNLSCALGLWTCVGLLIAWGTVASPALYIPLAGALVACLFFAHFILVVHECSHNMFVLSSNRDLQKKLNRAIGVVAGGAFFTDYIIHWEQGHTEHHLRPCEENDPQDKDPLTGRDLYKHYLGLMVIPFYFMKINPSNQYGFTWSRFLGGLAFWAPLLVLTGLFIGWWVPVMLILSQHFLMALNMTKKAQEHGGGLADEPIFEMRSRTYFYPTAFMTSPFNINYHFEHHANFMVPWYLLPAYHQRLMEIVPGELKPYIFHSDFLQQLAGKKPLIPEELRPLVNAS